jgi:drug/metabolite transporter (DMT)-like permease
MNGVLTALLAGVFLGLFQSLHGKADELPIRTGTMLLLVIAAVAANGFALVSAGPGAYGALSLRAVLVFGLAGAIHFSGGWLLIGLSQRRVGVGITGLLVGATPVFTALIAWAVVGEVLSIRDLAGIALVVVGVGVASWR